MALTLLLVIGISAYGLGTTTSTTVSPLSAQVLKADMFGISAGGGFQYLPLNELQIELDSMKTLGAKWLRIDFSWADIQSGGKNSYNWERYDRVVQESKARNIKVLGILGYTPTWARPTSCVSNDKCAPANSSDFGTFANAAALRYKDTGVAHWEVWNEPNITTFWQPQPNVQAYVSLLKSGYTNIKAANPNATVITGGLSPASSDGTNISPIDFVQGLYNNGAKYYFDAIGHHPYCYAGTFDCPTTYAPWSAWSQMSQTPTSIRSIMVANGDSNKKIWATEYGAPTKGDQSVSETQQAQMVTKSYDLFATYDWAGPLFTYSSRDAGTNVADREDWFGLRRYDGTNKPSFTAYKSAAAKYSVSTLTTTTTQAQPTTTKSPSTTIVTTIPTTTQPAATTTTTAKPPTTTTTTPPQVDVPAPILLTTNRGSCFFIWCEHWLRWETKAQGSVTHVVSINGRAPVSVLATSYLVTWVPIGTPLTAYIYTVDARGTKSSSTSYVING